MIVGKPFVTTGDAKSHPMDEDSMIQDNHCLDNGWTDTI